MKKSYQKEQQLRIQLRIMQKAKQNFLYLITGNLANSSNILNVENNVIILGII